jgi:hypothetical protein
MPLSDIRWNEFNGSWWRMLKQHVRFYSNDGDYKIVVMVFKRDYAKQCDAEKLFAIPSGPDNELHPPVITNDHVASASGTVQPVLKYQKGNDGL